MKVLFGLIVITAGFAISLEHLDQNLGQFWDVIAFAMVVFGTISVGITTLPSLRKRHILKIILRGTLNNSNLREKTINNSLTLIKGGKPQNVKYRIEDKVLNDGVELLQLGFNSEKIQFLLTERIEKYVDDNLSVSSWIRGLAKYPPAFGLAGTVLGLIHLMQGLSEGADPKETGIRMAVALIATFYGIVVANIFLNPLGDRIVNNIKEDQNLAEISLNTILMISEQNSHLELLESLNNYMPSQTKKLDVGNILAEAA